MNTLDFRININQIQEFRVTTIDVTTDQIKTDDDGSYIEIKSDYNKKAVRVNMVDETAQYLLDDLNDRMKDWQSRKAYLWCFENENLRGMLVSNYPENIYVI